MTSAPTDPKQLDAKVLAPGQPGPIAWGWPLLWLSLLAGSSAVGIWATVYMTRIPPLPDCQQISTFSADSDRLYCATAGAASNTDADLTAAVDLVAGWDEAHPLYDESRLRLSDWSRQLIDKARAYVLKGDLNQAKTLLSHIPSGSEFYPEAQQSLSAWQGEWDRGTALIKQVETAANAQDWETARRSLQDLKRLNSDYWVKTRYQALSQRVGREQTAQEQLATARELAVTGDIDQIAEAFTLARGVSVQSQAWPEAKAEIETWAAALLQYGFQKWEQEDIDAAVEIIQKVPVDLAKAPEAEDLIYFAHAQRLAAVDDAWVPTYGDMLNLVEAMQAIRQIAPTSPFYGDAQANLATWDAKLADLQQLYFANIVAQTGLRPAYNWAIARARQVAPDRPQRQQAQTLVSHWQKEIERIEDRPVLVRAEQLAVSGDIPALRRAIAEARKVELGRALRIDAQTKIATWLKRIEVIEDTPLLDKALQLAEQGKLREAVAEASKIQPGRALYANAQESVDEWTTRIQITEDQPILQRAEQLAAQGRLSEAIATASRIGRGRALSDQARSAIAVWSQQRDAIWESRRQAPDSAYDESNTDSDE